jgi:hypothetical protein
LGLVIDRFMTEERIKDIVKQPPGEATITDGLSYSTAAGYQSYLSKHIKPRWGSTSIAAIKALDVKSWLEKLPPSPKTRGQVRAVMRLLFERAMLWGLIDLQRNPIELAKLRAAAKESSDSRFWEVSGTRKQVA